MPKIKIAYTVNGEVEINVSDEAYQAMLDDGDFYFSDCEEIHIPSSDILDHVGQCNNIEVEWLNPPDEADDE